MQTDMWSTIESAFPINHQFSSRVLVTTSFQPVANACSCNNGYVHKMGRLDGEHSKILFLKKACPESHLNYDQPYTEQILKKCDGQALALVTVGQFLRKNGWPISPNCAALCRDLGQNLLHDETLERMRRVLVHSYASLPCHIAKACMLYFGMFPSNQSIRRKSLMRLWLAEGFLGAEPLSGGLNLAAKKFNKLIEHNIIETVDVSNNDKVKTCKTYGMMHEFIVLKSISQDFIALLGNEMLQEHRPSYVRRLSLHGSRISNGTSIDIDFSVVRSLAVFGTASQGILEFSRYELLRVLDLEECTAHLGDSLNDVCKLRLLKYLSLGPTITVVPNKIEKLRLLETLDLRRSRIDVLPKEVILLPCLVHLFGKFWISQEVNIASEKILLSGQSRLETLSGFVTDGSHVIAEIMCSMKKLRKVKIWLNEAASCSNCTKLVDAIQKYVRYDMDQSIDDRSLSLHLNKCSEDVLDHIEGPCFLTSLKLHGQLLKLPTFVLSLFGLTEVCLESNELTTGLLGQLCDLKDLQYLKLIAHQLGDFIISTGSFRRLLRLCLVLELPTLPTIRKGALEYLISLQLICKDLVGLSGVRIEYLECLKDVTLHDGVTQQTKDEWLEAAKLHPKWPKVLFL